MHEERYKDLVKELNNPAVTKFFAEARDQEEAHFRYRCFIDWNGLEISEWYKSYLKYKYSKETPPKNYVYDGRDLSNVDWAFFYEDMEGYYNNKNN